MDPEPFVIEERDRDWEGWPEAQLALRGGVVWKTLISAGLTPSSALTAGVARVPRGEALPEHRHEQAEVYFVLDGTGVVAIDGLAAEVAAGSTVFIPGNALHSVRSRGPGELRFFYVLAADTFDDVEYVFSSESGRASPGLTPGG
jgi:mannose-6-phosphate isomerase-like protein (cupin superfamily)